MSTKTRLYFFDTTLRDGAQTPAVEFTAEQKRLIAATLAACGFDYIEGGFPAEGNQTDLDFFDNPGDMGDSKLVAFGMTWHKDRKDNDPNFASVANAVNAATTCLVAKAWDRHVSVALRIEKTETYLDIIRNSTHAAAGKKETHIDLEHFFDGYQANPDYALNALWAAHEGGARWITLCDTNGGSTPKRIERIVRDILLEHPQLKGKLGIHCHNDKGLATINSLTAIEAGCTLIQGTVNGLGERCGNANLLEIIPTLMLDPDYRDDYDCGIHPDTLKTHFPSLRQQVYKLAGMRPRPDDPYYGQGAFATKAGIHASAVVKDAGLYEHVDPSLVGQKTRVRMSRQGGMSNLRAVLDQMGIHYDGQDEALKALYQDIMAMENKGWSFVYAEASLALLAWNHLGHDLPHLDVISAKTTTDIRFSTEGERRSPSETALKLRYNDTSTHQVSDSDSGPVDSMALALKKCLKDLLPDDFANGVTLTDYDVHNLDEGTDSRVRVQISFSGEINGVTREWTTVGVSENSYSASLKALADSYRWHLVQSGWVADEPTSQASPSRALMTIKRQ